MMIARTFVAAALLAASVTTASATDKTDLWWIPSESGWGMTMTHQAEVLFLTLYVFGADGQPTWVVATTTLQATDANNVETYSGPVYRVTGPYFGAPFNPAAVNAVQVGTATYRATTATTGQLTYSVNGVTVTKDVQRETLRNNPNVYGEFGGGYVSTTTGCDNPAVNGRAQTFVGLTVSGTPASTTALITFATNGATCTVAGSYQQAGRMGSIGGTISCGTGLTGTASLSEIEAGSNALTTRFTFRYAGCTESGTMAVGRR